MVTVKLIVNGHEYEREVEDRKRLLDFLREDLKLTGTKEGCGEGECGACTVIIDGYTANSCLLMVAMVNGKEITTIEGVGGEELSLLQKCFIDSGAVQCGFCTPGMILSAKALLDKNCNPTEAEIREAVSGNLCRCTGYEKIIKAIKKARDLGNEI